jgi:hypothetical protein
MSQIQLDNQKRFLRSCKNLQVQLPQRPHGRVLGRLGWAWPGALRHNPDIQGLTETGHSSLQRSQCQPGYNLTEGRAQGSLPTLFILMEREILIEALR